MVSVAEEDGELVADEFAAALGQDRRTAGETCALLLADVGRRASHAGMFWKHAAKDRGATGASGIGEPQIRADFR
jgi:hypothetical protein